MSANAKSESINMDTLIEQSRAINDRLQDVKSVAYRLLTKFTGDQVKTGPSDDQPIDPGAPILEIHHNGVKSHDTISDINEILNQVHSIVGLDQR